jgi:hypothetical protein
VDLYCQRCGEPWDYDGVYHGDFTTEEKERFLKGVDCPACKGKELCVQEFPCQDCPEAEETVSQTFKCKSDRIKKPFRATLAGVLTDILGEDTDGIAAEMEDAEYLLREEFWK